MKHDISGLVVCYAAIFLLSLNGLFSNSIALDAVSITQVRSVIAIMALAIFCFFSKRSLSIPRGSQTLLVYGVGILMGLHWITFFHAMQIASVAIGMLALYTFPVLTVLIEPFFSKKRIQTKDIVLAVVVIIGVTIMAVEHWHGEIGNALPGVLWGVLSALFFTFRNLIQKYHLNDMKSDSIMFHQLIMIALMFLFFIDFDAVQALSLRDTVLMFLLGIITTATAHTLLTIALKKLEAKTASLIGCMQPVIGAFFAWLVLGEAVTLYIVMGGLIILSIAVYESLAK